MNKKLETPHVVSYKFEIGASVKNLSLALNGEKPIVQMNPEVPVKKVV